MPDLRGSRSYGFPEYDPFWARVADAGIFVSMHASSTGYERIQNWWLGVGDREFLPFVHDTFGGVTDMLGRGSSDAMAALICHGVFDRHPNLRVASVENGASWVPALLKRLDRSYRQHPKSYKENPRDTFHRHIFVAPFYEDDTEELRTVLPVERILFGSDFPHPEGPATPLDYLEEFKTYQPDEVEKIFSTNLKGLLGGKRDNLVTV